MNCVCMFFLYFYFKLKTDFFFSFFKEYFQKTGFYNNSKRERFNILFISIIMIYFVVEIFYLYNATIFIPTHSSIFLFLFFKQIFK